MQSAKRDEEKSSIGSKTTMQSAKRDEEKSSIGSTTTRTK
jgi:hypothetical protein